MKYNYNENLVSVAQNLRKNMTPEEKHLWYDFFKKLPITVHRQKNIGNFVVDFYINDPPIVIEIDGAQHETDENAVADKKRDETLRKLGLTVLRYPNWTVNKNFEMVCNDILKNIGVDVSEIEWDKNN